LFKKKRKEVDRTSREEIRCEGNLRLKKGEKRNKVDLYWYNIQISSTGGGKINRYNIKTGELK